MDTAKAIEDAVEQLGRDELASFREWFSAFEAAQWDARIEQDIAAGNLEALADAAIEGFKSGKTSAFRQSSRVFGTRQRESERCPVPVKLRRLVQSSIGA